MAVEINYETGWAIVRHALTPSGRPIMAKTALDRVQKQMKRDGYVGLRGRDETERLADWERRRTGNKQFQAPEAMFVIRITDPTGKHNIGRSELNAWPE